MSVISLPNDMYRDKLYLKRHVKDKQQILGIASKLLPIVQSFTNQSHPLINNHSESDSIEFEEIPEQSKPNQEGQDQMFQRHHQDFCAVLSPQHVEQHQKVLLVLDHTV